MKAIQMLSRLTAEVINLEASFLINGENLVHGKYSMVFPIERNSELDGWFKAYFHYFCLYGPRDESYLFLGAPAVSVALKHDDESAIHFWIIED